MIENREDISAKQEEEKERISACSRRSHKEEKSCSIVHPAQKEVCEEKAGNLP